jgi:hypothetical protein
MLRSVSQSAWPTNEVVEIPESDSEEMRMVQMVLGVLSIYWQPLRKLVRNNFPSTPNLMLTR